MNALLKVFYHLIMKQKLQKYLIPADRIHKAQTGFMPKCRTSDHIFTLKTRTNKYVKDTKNGKPFACFVDFEKRIIQDSIRTCCFIS